MILPVEVRAPGVAGDGLGVVRAAVVDVPEAVPGAGLAVAVAGLLLQAQGLLAMGEGLAVAP